ncbi:MAG: hypothetical protein H2057_01335 [Alphaproteobacteria bacterium]|nr:hypothetical protein [Alphaproteobacteria bacterium]
MSYRTSFVKNLFLMSSTCLAATTYASEVIEGENLERSPKNTSTLISHFERESTSPTTGKRRSPASLSPQMPPVAGESFIGREQTDSFKSPPRIRLSERSCVGSKAKGVEHLLSPRLLPTSSRKEPRPAFVKTSSLRTVAMSPAESVSKNATQVSSHKDMRSLKSTLPKQSYDLHQMKDGARRHASLEAVVGAIQVLQTPERQQRTATTLKETYSLSTLPTLLGHEPLPIDDASGDELAPDMGPTTSFDMHIKWDEVSLLSEQKSGHIKHLDLSAIGLFCGEYSEIVELSQHVKEGGNNGITPSAILSAQEDTSDVSFVQIEIPSVPRVPRIPLDQLSKLHKTPVSVLPVASGSRSSPSSERVSPMSLVKSLSAEHVSFLVAMEIFDRQKSVFLADLAQQKSNNVILRSLSGRPTDRVYRDFIELNFKDYFSEAERGKSTSVAKDSGVILTTLLYIAEDFEQAVTWYGTMEKGRLSDTGLCETAKMLGNVCRFFDTYRLMLVHLYTSVWSVVPKKLLSEPDFTVERMQKGQATYVTGLRRLLSVVQDFQECLHLRHEQMEAAQGGIKVLSDSSDSTSGSTTPKCSSDAKLSKFKKSNATPRSQETQTVMGEQSDDTHSIKEKRGSKEKRRSAEKLSRQNSKTAMTSSSHSLQTQETSVDIPREPISPADLSPRKKKGFGHKFKQVIGL